MAGFCIAGFPLQAVAPPTPPPPPPGNTPAVTISFGPYINTIAPSPLVMPTLPTTPYNVPVQVGDRLVALLTNGNNPSNTPITGLPSGWSLVRQDWQAANGGDPPLLTAVLIKTATTFDTIANPTGYTFSPALTQTWGISIACIRGTTGVDSTSYASQASGGTISIPGTNCSQAGGELVLVLASAGTTTGADYVCAGSDASTVNTNDLPLATVDGHTDSMNRIFYMSSGLSAGTSPSHNITQRPLFQFIPTAGYLVAMLGT